MASYGDYTNYAEMGGDDHYGANGRDRAALLAEMRGRSGAPTGQTAAPRGEVRARTPEQPAGAPPLVTKAPEAEAPAVDTSKWNTDGYAAPKYTAQKAAKHAMAGWDQTKWADPNHQTPKYVMGRILSQYDPRDKGQVAQAVADLQRAFPGATFNGKDKITIPGVGTTDILQGASKFGGGAGEAWQYLGESASGGGGGGGAAGPGGFMAAGGPGLVDVGGNRSFVPDDGGFYQQLMAAMRSSLGNPDLDRQALLAEFKG